MYSKFFILTTFVLFNLITSVLYSQTFQNTDTINSPKSFDNIYNRPLYSDSLCSSFCILIKKEVKAHKHIYHSEHVYVLEGEGEMMLGDKKIKIKKGDIVFIPINTVHSLVVTSKTPVKILSFQSPEFDGKDRVMIETK